MVETDRLRQALKRYDQAAPGEIHDMARALTNCRLYLTCFGRMDPNELVQQIDDALAMYELREANVNVVLAEKSA